MRKLEQETKMSSSILCLLLILSLLLRYSAAAVSNTRRHGDCSTLLQFIDSFTIREDASRDFCNTEPTNSYPKTSSWKNGTDCCSWDGVTCDDDEDGNVIGLDLSCSWLQGAFLSNNTLFSLRNLRRLNLGGNNFLDSEIPSRFRVFAGDMTHLNLSGSSFTGPVPQEISHLSKLVSLDLSHGDFISPPVLEDRILKGILQNLTRLRRLELDVTDMSQVSPYSFMNISSPLNYLSLSYCSLQGVFVSNIFSLPQLQYLDLSANSGFRDINVWDSNWTSPLLALDLSGTLSEGKLLEKIVSLKTLQHLDLQSNVIVGETPTSIGNLTALNYLDLSATRISGSLPPTLANLEQLSYLDLQYNDNMTGTVDFEIFANMRKMRTLMFPPKKLNVVLQDGGNGSFPELTDLKLSGCNLTKFPYFLSSSRGLQYLDLSYNMISGPIPRWFWSLGNDTLERMYLSDNLITGVLQQFPWNKITDLELQNNLLHGPLPELLLPPTISEFHAYNNGFTGAIPTSICRANDLTLLFLSDNRLSGTIPGCISNLTILESLDLSSNHLEGPLPRSISNCTMLVNLNVGHNRITDTFPYWFLPNTLWNLDLQSNNFHGPIRLTSPRVPFVEITAYNLANNAFTGQWPIDYFLNSSDALYLIDLSNNKFGGPIPIPPPDIQYYAVSDNMFTGEIPSTMCDALDLKVMDLSNNSLFGNIPRCFSKINVSLSVLNLRKNKLIGEIPQIFGPNNILRTVDFSQNILGGTIPRSLANCKDLEVLDLSNNEIDDVFPSWLAALPKLQVLVIRSNRFHGHVEEFHSEDAHPFSQLLIFDISVNRFSGPLPTDYMANFKAMMEANNSKQGNLQFVSDTGYKYQDSVRVVIKGYEIELVKILKVFTTIDLSMNSFQGEFPGVVGNLKALKGLNFSHNNITGSISSSVGNLSNLEWLDLSSNNLTGEIPPSMAGLTSLAYLNLSRNRLRGPIPVGNQFNTFSSDEFEGNPGLCGFPLPKACGSEDNRESPSSNSTEEKGQKWIEWRAVSMGCGCGIVFGISLGYILLETGRPEWLVEMIEKERSSRKSKRSITNTAPGHRRK